MAKETYEMQAECHNCRTTFIVEFSKGEKAEGVVKSCPYCDHCYYYGFTYTKPTQPGDSSLTRLPSLGWFFILKGV